MRTTTRTPGGSHDDLHSEDGALPGEHPGRAADPVVKVVDLAWLEFEKPDLRKAAAFAHDFGLETSLRTADELHLRGTLPGGPCVVVRRGPRSRYLGPAFRAGATLDLRRLAHAHGRDVTALPEAVGGQVVDLTDPAGRPVRVVAGVHELPAMQGQRPLTWNVGARSPRVNAVQRPVREPARVERLGHVMLQTTTLRADLDWYLGNLGLIVSDFLYFAGRRGSGPASAFLRCDRGADPADHHTLALNLGPSNRYVHSAYQVADLDALAAGGEHLRTSGHTRVWGIGRHLHGSQIFDYWKDPDGLMVEHFADGDAFDDTVAPGWDEFKASGLSQWGPRVTADFLGTRPGVGALREFRQALLSLREDNEFDARSALGLLRSAGR